MRCAPSSRSTERCSRSPRPAPKPQKSLDVALEAVAAVPGITLAIAGDGQTARLSSGTHATSASTAEPASLGPPARGRPPPLPGRGRLGHSSLVGELPAHDRRGARGRNAGRVDGGRGRAEVVSDGENGLLVPPRRPGGARRCDREALRRRGAPAAARGRRRAVGRRVHRGGDLRADRGGAPAGGSRVRRRLLMVRGCSTRSRCRRRSCGSSRPSARSSTSVCSGARDAWVVRTPLPPLPPDEAAARGRSRVLRAPPPSASQGRCARLPPRRRPRARRAGDRARPPRPPPRPGADARDRGRPRRPGGARRGSTALRCRLLSPLADALARRGLRGMPTACGRPLPPRVSSASSARSRRRPSRRSWTSTRSSRRHPRRSPSAGALFVGVLERYKAVDVLAEAWRLAAPRVPEATLRIVGRGTLREVAERLVTDFPEQCAGTSRCPRSRSRGHWTRRRCSCFRRARRPRPRCRGGWRSAAAAGLVGAVSVASRPRHGRRGRGSSSRPATPRSRTLVRALSNRGWNRLGAAGRERVEPWLATRRKYRTTGSRPRRARRRALTVAPRRRRAHGSQRMNQTWGPASGASSARYVRNPTRS